MTASRVKTRPGASPQFRTFTGTTKEVLERLKRLPAERAIAFTFSPAEERTARAVAELLTNLEPLVSRLVVCKQQEALDKIIDFLVPAIPPSRHMVIEAQMAAKAREAVFASAEWLTAGDIAEMAGFSRANPSAQPNKWKKEGRIFALHHKNADYFPAYGLDHKAGYRPLPALAKVLKVFDKRKDSWGLAYWFASVNSFLAGRRPQDLLASQPAKVIEAARDELEAVAHG